MGGESSGPAPQKKENKFQVKVQALKLVKYIEIDLPRKQDAYQKASLQLQKKLVQENKMVINLALERVMHLQRLIACLQLILQNGKLLVTSAESISSLKKINETDYCYTPCLNIISAYKQFNFQHYSIINQILTPKLQMKHDKLSKEIKSILNPSYTLPQKRQFVKQFCTKRSINQQLFGLQPQPSPMKLPQQPMHAPSHMTNHSYPDQAMGIPGYHPVPTIPNYFNQIRYEPIPQNVYQEQQQHGFARNMPTDIKNPVRCPLLSQVDLDGQIVPQHLPYPKKTTKVTPLNTNIPPTAAMVAPPPVVVVKPSLNKEMANMKSLEMEEGKLQFSYPTLKDTDLTFEQRLKALRGIAH